MDVHTKEQRSFNMSRVKSENTKPEVIMFSLLKKAKIKFRKHYPIIGRPDIVFLKEKVAVFIDGEFWHGKNYLRERRSLPSFWVKKIGENLRRDRRTSRKLRADGWHIIRLWDKGIIRCPERSLWRILRFVEKVKVVV